MKNLRFVCAKCQNKRCEVGEIRAAAGFWSKIFDVQGKRFTTLTCTRCRYCEMYHTATSKIGNVLDLFTG